MCLLTNYLILVCLNSLKLFSKNTAHCQNRKKNIACDLNVLMLNLQIILRKCERTSWNGKLRSEWLDNQTIALKPYPRGINLPENILVVWKASGTRYANAICFDFAKSSSFCKEMVCDVAIWKGILDLA